MDPSVSIDLQPRDGGKMRQEGSAGPYSTYPYSGLGQSIAGQSIAGQEPPRDFVLWSLFNTIFCNVCCLGFMALVFSFKARDRKVLGDANGAGSYGKTAKCLNITVLVLSLLTVILIIVLVATGAVPFSHTVQHGNQNRNSYGINYGN
ncbi:dispanin subfamily A member 2b-like [Dermochelys coriacea]|uniref:dispanin subfamily A member 2b-like n=1 Tax=Dermochelys coriacea TaxID=27794 RepID=UPI0018E8A0F0|nr:dispanin subfamily A member 2b-like [Dermochelys coriacea]